MKSSCGGCDSPHDIEEVDLLVVHDVLHEPLASLEQTDALAVLRDVQVSLESLRGEVLAQHLELTAQLARTAISPNAPPAARVVPAPACLKKTEIPTEIATVIPVEMATEIPMEITDSTEIVAERRNPKNLDMKKHIASSQLGMSATSWNASASTSTPAVPRRSREPRITTYETLTKQIVSEAVAKGVTFGAHTSEGVTGTNTQQERMSHILWRKVLQDVWQGSCRHAVTHVVRWDGFDRIIGFIIFVNAVTIGVEIDLDKKGEVYGWRKSALDGAEVFFLLVYVVELALRFYADRRHALRSGWVVFDLALVLVGIATQILAPLLDVFHVPGVLEQLTLLRVIRLLRLVRAVRLVKQFKTLWRLVNGLLTSYDAILSTLVLILLVLYVASCIGVELITSDQRLLDSTDPSVQDLVHLFGSLETAMLTLVRFVTADSVSGIYEPIILAQPYLVVYFMPLLLVISISLLNLITAVLVEGALDKAKKDRETVTLTMRRKVKTYLPVVRELFQCMDLSGDGSLTLDEIRHSLTEGNPQAQYLAHNLNKIVPFDSVLELFESLDANGDGEITEEEFVHGVLKTALGENENLEINQILRLVRVIARNVHAAEPEARKMSSCTGRAHE